MSGPARGLGCGIVVLVQTEPAVESRKRGRQLRYTRQPGVAQATSRRRRSHPATSTNTAR